MTRLSAHARTRRRTLAALAAAGSTPLLAGGALAARTSEDDIVIGQSAHLSGPLAPTFTAVMRGQQLAIDQFNKRGGVGGRKVRLVALDDAYDPKRCVENCAKLIAENNPVALFGLAQTAAVLGVLPLLADKKVPLVGVYTGSPALRTKHHPYLFTTMASYKDEVQAMLRNLVMLQRKNVAVLYQPGPFGQLMAPVVEESAREAGVTIVSKVTMDVAGTEAVAAAQTLAAGHPQAVLFVSFGPGFVPFVKAARSYIGAPLYSISIANSRPAIVALGDESRGLAFTQIVPNAARLTNALTRDYDAAMTAAKAGDDYAHWFGFLNIRVLLEGLKRAGRGVTSQSLVTTLEGMGKTNIGGYVVDYTPTNHHGSKFVEMTIIGPGGKIMS